MFHGNPIIAFRISTIVCLSLLLCGPFVLRADNKAHRQKSSREMVLKLSKRYVTPEEVVRLQELIPAEAEVRVRDIMHDVVRIAHYDNRLGMLVNLDCSEYQVVNPSTAFDNLPAFVTWSHSIEGGGFRIQNPRYKGEEFNFRPKQLGAFLITAEWHLRATNEKITSQPIVLVVRPPKGPDGRPVVKPEWLVPE